MVILLENANNETNIFWIFVSVLLANQVEDSYKASFIRNQRYANRFNQLNKKNWKIILVDSVPKEPKNLLNNNVAILKVL